MLPNDSRNELAKTICKQLGRRSRRGDDKFGACTPTFASSGAPRPPSAPSPPLARTSGRLSSQR